MTLPQSEPGGETPGDPPGANEGSRSGPANRGLERTAGWLFIVAGAIHGVVTPDHFAEWWGYGLFFALAALLQVVWGLGFITHAINERDAGPSWRRLKTAFIVLGILGILATIVLYVVTRTTGIPLFGPEAGEVEPVAPIDVLSKLVEVVLVGVLFVVLRRHRMAQDAGAPGS